MRSANIAIPGTIQMQAFSMCALFFTYQKCIDFAKKAGLDEGEARNIILARESTDREGIA